MEITLNKANKAIKAVNEALKENNPVSNRSGMFSQGTDVGIISVNVSTGKTGEVFMAEIEKKKKKYIEKIDNYNALLKDKFNLKKALFKKNLECGLSEILSQLDYSNANANLMKLCIDGIKNSGATKDVTVDAFNIEKEIIIKGEDPIQNINAIVAMHDVEKLEGEYKGLRKQISKLEDEKVFKNADTKIDVEISDCAKGLLGL